MRAISLLVCAGMLLGILGVRPALADDNAPTRVGRLSLVDGHVGYRPAGGDWSDAVVNLPVATGTVLRTDGQARAEFRLGDRRIALAPDTELDLAAIDDHTTELAVKRGRIGVELRRLGDDETVEIDLPRGGVWLAKPGHYDVAAGGGSDPTRIAAFDGAARFVGGGADVAVAANSTAVLRGQPLTATFEDAAADAFTGGWWGSGAGDRILPAMLHLSPEISGIEALDGSGQWEAVPGYGPVWFASGLPDDWTPYRDGSWRWVQPWGWTWIDDRPWGFATTHYGRWARLAGSAGGSERWGWVPGTPVDHPAYAPALVGFLGTAGVGLSYPEGTGPAIAWYPLAPGEIYRPGFTRDIAAIRRLNLGSVADPATIALDEDGGLPAEIIGGHGQNRHFASAIPRAAFTAGKPVRPALVDIPPARLDEVPLVVALMHFPPPPEPARTLARIAAPTPVKVLMAAVARLASPPRPPMKPVAVRDLRSLARILVVRPAVRVAHIPVVRLTRAAHDSLVIATTARLNALRRQHLASVRGTGR